MMPLSSTRRRRARWLFVSDVDDTLLGNDAALAELMRALAEATGSLIVAYNSSRPCASLRRSIDTTPYLGAPDYLIGALGTEIQLGRTGETLPDYSGHVDQRWDRTRVAEIAADMGLIPHADEYQTPFKASYDVAGSRDYLEMVRKLDQAGLQAKVIFSGGKNLDLIPVRAGKGEAIQFLRQHLGITSKHVVVAGDSGNDLEMFELPNKGVVVANADADLKSRKADHIYHASADYAAGVLEGLRWWGVLA